MMKLMFMLAAITFPLCASLNKGASGILLSMFFLLLAAFVNQGLLKRVSERFYKLHMEDCNGGNQER